MSSVWFKNFIGIRCSDYELLRVPRPKLEFGIHVSFKTVQLGTLAGSMMVGPMLHILSNDGLNKNGTNLSESSVKAGLLGAGIGLVAGPLLSIGYYNGMSKIENYDQCYRLRYDTSQLNVDRMSVLGALIGAGLAGGPGFVAGADVGILCGLLLNGVQSVRFKI